MTNQSHSFKGGARLAVFSSTLTLFVLLLTSVASTPTTYAATFPACVADDIIAGDPGCPASGFCTITKPSPSLMAVSSTSVLGTSRLPRVGSFGSTPRR